MNKRQRKKRLTKVIYKATYPWWTPMKIDTSSFSAEQLRKVCDAIKKLGETRLTLPSGETYVFQ